MSFLTAGSILSEKTTTVSEHCNYTFHARYDSNPPAMTLTEVMANDVKTKLPPNESAIADELKTEHSPNGNALVNDVKQEPSVDGNNGSLKLPRGPSKAQQLNKLYSLPAPLRTFPLPTFVPHNPISLFHILYTWISQTVQPPSSHPDAPYHAWYSPETRSVHVTDPRAIRALWEQGFYGKGSLSRSEPSWLDREKRRTGMNVNQTSEEVTRQRRAERQQIKWERARKEREAIDQTLFKERSLGLGSQLLAANSSRALLEEVWLAPVGPFELLRLPNSANDLPRLNVSVEDDTLHYSENQDLILGRQANGSLPDGEPALTMFEGKGESSVLEPNLSVKGDRFTLEIASAGIRVNGPAHGSVISVDSAESSKGSKCHKSVRFSPTVEKTTFFPSEPPSPDLAASSAAQRDVATLDKRDQEHLQLTMEEALFLSYGLGVLTVLDRKSKIEIPTKELFFLGRQLSYFPPSELLLLSPDDSFMLSYVVYHHFRSLGWVVRGGTKFSVDYLLYNRGPVFSHAEFAVLILPSYSDPYWSADEEVRKYASKKEGRRWSWLHCINRVNSQVKKTLVLVYVEVPPPLAVSSEDEIGIGGILGRYKVRELILKRWISNRSRD